MRLVQWFKTENEKVVKILITQNITVLLTKSVLIGLSCFNLHIFA